MSGIGGGALLTLVLIILSDIVSLRDRGKYQGIVEAIIAVCQCSTSGARLTAKPNALAGCEWRWSRVRRNTCPKSDLALGILHQFAHMWTRPLRHWIRTTSASSKGRLQTVSCLSHARRSCLTSRVEN